MIKGFLVLLNLVVCSIALALPINVDGTSLAPESITLKCEKTEGLYIRNYLKISYPIKILFNKTETLEIPVEIYQTQMPDADACFTHLARINRGLVQLLDEGEGQSQKVQFFVDPATKLPFFISTEDDPNSFDATEKSEIRIATKNIEIRSGPYFIDVVRKINGHDYVIAHEMHNSNEANLEINNRIEELKGVIGQANDISVHTDIQPFVKLVTSTRGQARNSTGLIFFYYDFSLRTAMKASKIL